MRALLIMLCLVSAIAHAEAEPAAPAATWGLPQLMQSLARVQSSQGKFVERKHLAVLDVPLTYSGTLSFRAPDHLEKHTLEPKEESLVLDQGVLTIENKARNLKRTLVLQQYPAIWAFVESIRSTLNGDLGMLERFYQVEFDGQSDAWRLQLVPKDERMSRIVSLILISGAGDRIESIEIREAQGDRSVMTVLEERR